MRIAVIGLGSMGKRRIKLLTEVLHCDVIGIDKNMDRIKQCHERFGILCYSTLQEALEKQNVDAGIVSTSPLSHYSIAKELLENNIHVFTEINLVSDGYQELINLAKKREKVLFLSSTKLYRYEIKRIREAIQNENKMNYIYHIGQYLPDWHPWEDYKNFFVSDTRTNACREIFAIEFPWLLSLFGDIEEIHVVRQKTSQLELNYPDTYMILLRHKGATLGSLIVDVVSRKAVRDFQLFSENLFIQWDGTPHGYFEWNSDNGHMEPFVFEEKIIKENDYADNIIENDYLEELKLYLDKIRNPALKLYDFEDDLRTLAVIDEIESKGK